MPRAMAIGRGGDLRGAGLRAGLPQRIQSGARGRHQTATVVRTDDATRCPVSDSGEEQQGGVPDRRAEPSTDDHLRSCALPARCAYTLLVSQAQYRSADSHGDSAEGETRLICFLRGASAVEFGWLHAPTNSFSLLRSTTSRGLPPDRRSHASSLATSTR